MSKALSVDLRERVIAAIDEGMSCRGAAVRFGVAAPDELLAHLSPMSWAHVGLTGDYLWAEAATAGGLRPLNDPADRLYRAA